MLFLVRAEVASIPRDGIDELLERVVEEWEMVTAWVESGHIKACGKLAGRSGAVAIFEVPDWETMDEIAARLPLARYFDRLQIEPLIPASDALERARRRRDLYRRVAPKRRKPVRDGATQQVVGS